MLAGAVQHLEQAGVNFRLGLAADAEVADAAVLVEATAVELLGDIELASPLCQDAQQHAQVIGQRPILQYTATDGGE